MGSWRPLVFMAPTNQTKLQVDKTIANLFAPQGASWRTLCHIVSTSYKAEALAEACKAGNTQHLRCLLLLDEGGTALASSTAEHPELSPLMTVNKDLPPTMVLLNPPGPLADIARSMYSHKDCALSNSRSLMK